MGFDYFLFPWFDLIQEGSWLSLNQKKRLFHNNRVGDLKQKKADSGIKFLWDSQLFFKSHGYMERRQATTRFLMYGSQDAWRADKNWPWCHHCPRAQKKNIFLEGGRERLHGPFWDTRYGHRELDPYWLNFLGMATGITQEPKVFLKGPFCYRAQPMETFQAPIRFWHGQLP